MVASLTKIHTKERVTGLWASSSSEDNVSFDEQFNNNVLPPTFPHVLFQLGSSELVLWHVYSTVLTNANRYLWLTAGFYESYCVFAPFIGSCTETVGPSRKPGSREHFCTEILTGIGTWRQGLVKICIFGCLFSSWKMEVLGKTLMPQWITGRKRTRPTAPFSSRLELADLETGKINDSFVKCFC